MPSWRLVAGTSAGVAITASTYARPSGALATNSVESLTQFSARDAYTLSDLYVWIGTNSRDSTTTVRTRKNVANGAQSVSIATAATGVFEDSTNSDSLVSGDEFNYQISLAAGTGTITPTLISTVLSTAANNTPILGSNGSAYITFGLTRYLAVLGTTGATTATETRAQYTFRAVATLSNLSLDVSQNNLDGASTVTLRINGVNGSETLSIPAATTGVFEDAANTDSIAVGDEVNLQLVTGGTTGGLTIQPIWVKSTSVGRQTASTNLGSTTLAFGLTRYITLEGNSQSFASTEADTQLTMRIAGVGKNFFVNVPTNSVNNGSTFRTRLNGANGALSVSVPASTTGFFEDLVNSDTLATTDSYNYQVVTGGTAGTMVICAVGFELQQPIAITVAEMMAARQVSGMQPVQIPVEVVSY